MVTNPFNSDGSDFLVTDQMLGQKGVLSFSSFHNPLIYFPVEKVLRHIAEGLSRPFGQANQGKLYRA